MSKLPEYNLDRVFNASREMVWKAWTDPALIPRWYGPGAETIVHKYDLREGGLWLGEMKWGGKSNFSRVVFQEVVPIELLVWHDSTADSEWNIISSPMMADWPRVMLTTVKFAESGDKTNVRLTWSPFEATNAEIACFTAAVSGMGKGWESGFALMDDLLKELI